jgi:branched-chain amino acid aminotransferase
MRRLYDSCRVYRMEPGWSVEELTAAVIETVRANGYQSCYIRPLVYRGLEQLGLDPAARARSMAASWCGNGTRCSAPMA